MRHLGRGPPGNWWASPALIFTVENDTCLRSTCKQKTAVFLFEGYVICQTDIFSVEFSIKYNLKVKKTADCCQVLSYQRWLVSRFVYMWNAVESLTLQLYIIV